jgi:hypothetical protein
LDVVVVVFAARGLGLGSDDDDGCVVLLPRRRSLCQAPFPSRSNSSVAFSISLML